MNGTKTLTIIIHLLPAPAGYSFYCFPSSLDGDLIEYLMAYILRPDIKCLNNNNSGR